ncbi:MAG: RNA-directed DNA polymerase [Gammaproteobacteria bacterium]|nr:RNA-directed DNA polymerase [Pseudoalteromonas sp.]MCP4273365.1 RNA-directed DNA polymerase [Gammaproteobacteria bacterium]
MTKKRDYLSLIQATTKPELASLLGISASFLTRVLYKTDTSSLYHEFQIPKKSGGERTISAPCSELKDIQRRLSKLLQDCNDVIRIDNGIDKHCLLSHGFERNHSIITNAAVHRGKKNVLNLDLEKFFDSFNFGRVRGFFIKNMHFALDPHIATVIAQIACFNDGLPQGSPCSPVITNLITNSLDIRLSRLAKRNGCSYSRYADDITISTRKSSFSSSILKSIEPIEPRIQLRSAPLAH